MSNREERLLDLLERWKGQERGEPPTVDELCRDCPELTEDLRSQIAMHQHLERKASANQGAPETNSPSALGTNRAPSAAPEPELPCVPGHEGLVWLGGGGMGAVYRARNVALGREVALKLVRPERLTIQMLDRLQVEARAVAQLDHPHIVKVYEVGQCPLSEGGPVVPWIALELVPGGSLAKRLEREELPPREAARLVMLLARALQHAHDRAVIHRDLKPDNVLLAAPMDEPGLNTSLGCPKLTDFGLARQMNEEDRLTRTGMVMGTPAYMAPEQAEGEKTVGPSADIYGLGAVLYRLLAGRVPFKADSMVDVLYQVVHQAPEPVRTFRPEVPAELEAICLRCLQKQPAQRYPSAGALADALRGWLEGESTQSHHAEKATASGPARRRRFAGVLAALVAAVALGGMAWWFWPVSPKPAVNPEQGEGRIVEPAAWKGFIDIEMTRPGDPLRQMKRVSNPAARPLQAGDEVRIKVEVSPAAYVYVVWIDTKGEVVAVFPWIKGDWKRRRQEKRLPKLDLPVERADGVFTVDPGEPGMEALVLLVRESPLPQSVELEKLLAGLGPQKRRTREELDEVGWFENGWLVKNEKERAANVKNPSVTSNPMLRLQQTLRERLAEHFAYTRAVAFGNLGGK